MQENKENTPRFLANEPNKRFISAENNSSPKSVSSVVTSIPKNSTQNLRDGTSLSHKKAKNVEVNQDYSDCRSSSDTSNENVDLRSITSSITVQDEILAAETQEHGLPRHTRLPIDGLVVIPETLAMDHTQPPDHSSLAKDVDIFDDCISTESSEDNSENETMMLQVPLLTSPVLGKPSSNHSSPRMMGSSNFSKSSKNTVHGNFKSRRSKAVLAEKFEANESGSISPCIDKLAAQSPSCSNDIDGSPSLLNFQLRRNSKVNTSKTTTRLQSDEILLSSDSGTENHRKPSDDACDSLGRTLQSKDVQIIASRSCKTSPNKPGSRQRVQDHNAIEVSPRKKKFPSPTKGRFDAKVQSRKCITNVDDDNFGDFKNSPSSKATAATLYKKGRSPVKLERNSSNRLSLRRSLTDAGSASIFRGQPTKLNKKAESVVETVKKNCKQSKLSKESFIVSKIKSNIGKLIQGN